MMLRAFAAFGFAFALAACDVTPVAGPVSGTGSVTTRIQPDAPSARQNARSFVSVVSKLEPVAERECRARTQNMNCDFNIVVDD